MVGGNTDRLDWCFVDLPPDRHTWRTATGEVAWQADSTEKTPDNFQSRRKTRDLLPLARWEDNLDYIASSEEMRVNLVDDRVQDQLGGNMIQRTTQLMLKMHMVVQPVVDRKAEMHGANSARKSSGSQLGRILDAPFDAPQSRKRPDLPLH